MRQKCLDKAHWTCLALLQHFIARIWMQFPLKMLRKYCIIFMSKKNTVWKLNKHHIILCNLSNNLPKSHLCSHQQACDCHFSLASTWFHNLCRRHVTLRRCVTCECRCVCVCVYTSVGGWTGKVSPHKSACCVAFSLDFMLCWWKIRPLRISAWKGGVGGGGVLMVAFIASGHSPRQQEK